MRLMLSIQYNGNGLYGWQSQHNPPLPTVEGHLRRAFLSLVGAEPTELVAAGRTDAGVHALGQVAHADVGKPMPLIKYLDGLNHFLPASIRIQRVAHVEENFHARFGATSRTYRYLMAPARHLPPHLEGRVGKIQVGKNHPLPKIAYMQEAMEKIGLGTIDFSSMQDSECQSRTPMCNLENWNLTATSDPLGTPLIMLDITANHFLHHMVRNLVGTLVQIGQGEYPPSHLKTVLDKKDRRCAGPTFSPNGLYLTHVTYPGLMWKDVAENPLAPTTQIVYTEKDFPSRFSVLRRKRNPSNF